jgi:hypothetical protein
VQVWLLTKHEARLFMGMLLAVCMRLLSPTKLPSSTALIIALLGESSRHCNCPAWSAKQAKEVDLGSQCVDSGSQCANRTCVTKRVTATSQYSSQLTYSGIQWHQMASSDIEPPL